MTIAHSTLPEADLHELKGASTATSNQVPMSNGSGSTTFQRLIPFGGWRYNDIATGTTFTAPTAYTLMDVGGISTHLSGFSFNSASRLTYTGTPDRHVAGFCQLSVSHSTGTGQDITIAFYKNGSIAGTPNIETVQTADSGNKNHLTIALDDLASTNDYYEIYLKTPSGDVIVHTAYMWLIGIPEA